MYDRAHGAARRDRVDGVRTGRRTPIGEGDHVRRDRRRGRERRCRSRARESNGLGVHDRAHGRRWCPRLGHHTWTVLVVRRRLPLLGRETDRHLRYDTRVMGFFRKLFGSSNDDEPSAPAPAPAEAPTAPATSEDPYRGSGYVATGEHEEVVHAGPADPIFHYRGRVLALDVNRRGPLPLRAMVYSGLDGEQLVLRRITFAEKGYRIDWEHRTPFEHAIDGYVVRLDDRILVPLRSGMMAIHTVTGKPCWELPHSAMLAKPPKVDDEGNVLLVFEDQSWMFVHPRDGATVREGVARNEREVSTLAEPCSKIGDHHGTAARYSGVILQAKRGALYVNKERGGGAEGEPTAPTVGQYEIDSEWEATQWVALVGGKLLVALVRRWGDKQWAAVGVLDPTSLEPRQLLELGEVTTSLSCWVVDDLAVIDTDVADDPDDVFFIVDPAAERVVAMLRESKADAYMFDPDGARIWAKPV